MNVKHWNLLLIGAAFLVGCAKKPPPAPPEPEPPRVSAPAPKTESRVDEEALRRQRIQARIADTFRPIYFAYDQSTLSTEGKSICEGIGALMKEVPEITARIEGHADERGTNEYNLALGERRAQTVQQYLTSYGVGGSRLSVISYGEEKPAMEGQDESSWSKNRRAEFTASF
jgi:peptidoglycan-associated lipoprotein